MKNKLIAVVALSVACVADLGAVELGASVGMNIDGGLSYGVNIENVYIGMDSGTTKQGAYDLRSQGVNFGYMFNLSNNWRVMPLVGYEQVEYWDSYETGNIYTRKTLDSMVATVGIGLRYQSGAWFVDSKITQSVNKHALDMNIYVNDNGNESNTISDLGHEYSTNFAILVGLSF